MCDQARVLSMLPTEKRVLQDTTATETDGRTAMGNEESAGIRALDFDELSPALQDAFRARYERLGYLGGFFRYASHQPDAILAFNEITESLKGALPEDLAELVALTVASRLDNRYERHQHEQLSIKRGLGEEFVAAAISDEDQPAAFDERQSAVRALTLAVLADFGNGANDRLAEVAKMLGEDAAIGVLLFIGRYVAHAVVSNTLELEPPVPSIFDERRG